MRFESEIGDLGEIAIPDGVIRELDLAPKSLVTVDVTAITPQQQTIEPDWQKARAFVDSLQERMRAELHADGYASVDEYVDDIRGR